MKFNSSLNILLIPFFLLLFISSCTEEEKEVNSIDYFDVPTAANLTAPKGIQLQIDTIRVQDDLVTSYSGYYRVHQNKLYFFDEVFNYVFRFTENGELIYQHLGRGKGPNEVLGIHETAITNDRYYFLNHSNSTYAVFNENFEKVGVRKIDPDIKRSIEDILENPLPNVADAYEFDYGIPDIFQTYDENHLVIAMNASHPTFNGYFSSDLLYNYSRVLALINKESGKVVRLIGRRSPVYLEQKNIPNFNHVNYRITNSEIVLSFWVDDYIYILDKETEKVIHKFGVAGQNMKTDYVRTITYEEAEDNLDRDMDTFGYYHYLYYAENQNLLFRGYKKGANSTTDGLQIYKDRQLVLDMNVPLGFKVIGNNNQQFYASNSSEDNEVLEFYKLSIKDEIE